MLINDVKCATLGGLTGSTYAPIIAREARRTGKYVEVNPIMGITDTDAQKAIAILKPKD